MTNEEKKQVKEFLLQDTPILFLGAGFSRFSTKKTGERLPIGDELRQSLFEHFIEGNSDLTPKDKKEIGEYTLRQLCEIISKSLNYDYEMRDYIFEKFSGAQPQDFHRKLTSFPWKRIYTVNIDDLVETIYKLNGEHLTVQNTEKKKEIYDNSIELIKLHGCVNKRDEPIVFSESDYTNLISGPLDYRLNDLIVDLQNSSFIFIGVSLDEPDINYYLSVYEGAGYELGRGKILCVTPDPSFSVRMRIKNLNGTIINAKAEEFLNYLQEINYNPDELEKAKNRLTYSGIHNYQTIMNSLESGIYESYLYQGFQSNWRDLRDNWIIICPDYYKIVERIEKITNTFENVYCLAIYGKRFSGKGCLLKLLSAYLFRLGYEVLLYNGKEFKRRSLYDYIERSPKLYFALIIEEAAFYYPEVEQCLKRSIGEKHLLIITTSREYYHFKKKYYLEDNPFEEYELVDRITLDYALEIHRKLLEKGATGSLNRDVNIAKIEILKKRTLVNLFTSISIGKGFMSRINEDIDAISSINNVFNLYIGLALFDKADLEYYPKELLNKKIAILFRKDSSKNTSKLGDRERSGAYIVDYISYSENGLTIKNRIILDYIWDRATKSLKTTCLLFVLQEIAPYVVEARNNYWKIIFESLLKEEWLEKALKLDTNEIIQIYYQLKGIYSDISYYWLQLGIAEQSNKNYDKAQIHLDMALTIRPHAYQIQHAIARNYLRHAYAPGSEMFSNEFYNLGREKILNLIESKEYYKKKAKDYSIHCYISETINYMNYFHIKPTRDETKRMKRYIDRMNPDDPLFKSLVYRLTKFLKNTGAIDYISMSQSDEMLRDLFVDVDNDYDYVIDSYQ